ncbi:MAG: BBP7 family outer membrane beta-barrel protein [Pirellulales bacterium]|nr:BBP7 family outer membrane beta-barrel protein [Pirellulales bacterium]
MKTFRFLAILLLISFWATTATAQYSLYGAPDVLRLPPTQTSVMQPAYQAPQSGPVASPTYPVYGGAAVPVDRKRPVLAEDPIPELDPGTPAVRKPNLLTKMMAESSGCGPVADATCAPADCDASCGPVDCEPACCSPWFAAAGWITMGRDKANRVWTSYNTADLSDQLTNTGDIEMDWGNGGEIRFGRRFCGCCGQNWALEAVYWTMNPVHGFLSTTNPNLVSTPLAVDYINFGAPPVSGIYYFDSALEHRLWRRNEVHNIELNLLSGDFMARHMDSWNVQWAMGVRYFRFAEDLKFGSLKTGTWGGSGGTEEAYIDDSVKNNLVGFQLGFDARSNRWHNLQLYVAPKIGVYNNHIENTFSIYRGDGLYATPDGGGSYPVHATDNVFSVLTEVDLGLYWHVTENWSAKVGYRLVAATNMGLADDQIPFYVNDVPEIQHIKYNGDLLLHGAYVGVTYNY